MGFFLVLIVLGILWIVTAVLGKVLGSEIPAEQLAPPVAKPAAAPEASADDGQPSDEEVAAVAVVVALILGRKSRIVSIRRASGHDWNMEGRREHFASHRLR
jgi:Na+-transporting methylmalonyl-CoA/oxaloacetate decarboxylase gamma subunit